jgi:fructan beta-fructosidase
MPPALNTALDTPAWRPRLHYTPQRNWINDPNGLFVLDGEYHVYYQHNPGDTVWGDIGWGHAVSTDLLHWEERPLALPATDEEMVFSGCVVIDEHNASGLAPVDAAHPPLLAYYTRFDRHTKLQSQCLAYSLDRGESFERWPGNPLLDIGSQEFRDPFVFRHEASGRWVMLVAHALEQQIGVYTSEDLLDWQRASAFGPAGAVAGTIWEVPVLLQLPVDGEPGQQRWVLFVSVNGGTRWGGSGVQYFVGDFDGERFIADAADDPATVRWADHGRDFYAPLPFAGLKDERPVWLGWMNNWDYARELPTAPWRGQLSLPRELSLLRSDDEWRLVQGPAAQALRAAEGPALLDVRRRPASEAAKALSELNAGGRQWRARLRVARESVLQPLALAFFAGTGEPVRVGFDPVMDAYFIDRRKGAPSFAGESEMHHAPRDRARTDVEFEVWVDGCTVELFADGATVVLSDLAFPSHAGEGVVLQHGSADPMLDVLNLQALMLDATKG